MIAVELRKLVTRPRTWISMGLLVGLPVVIAVFVEATGVAPRPGEGPAFLSQVLSNGTLYAAAALAIVLPLFLPIAVLVVAGDAIAGEAQAGTLRYLLTRPVGRTRLLVAKLVTVIVFVLLAVILVAGTGYIAGALLFGTQPLPTLSGGQPLNSSQASFRIVFSMFYVGVSMLGVAAFGLFLSSVTDAPLGATLGGLAVLVASGYSTSSGRPPRSAVPADALLAVVRGPVPRPDPVAGRRTRPGAAGRLRGRAARRLLGGVRDPRRHELSAARKRPVPSTVWPPT